MTPAERNGHGPPAAPPDTAPAVPAPAGTAAEHPAAEHATQVDGAAPVDGAETADIATANTDGSNGVQPEAVNAPVVEAALLLEGHPATPARLSRITGLPAAAVERCLAALRRRYAAPEHGLQVTRVADSYSLTPKAELWERLRGHYGNGAGKRLSRAAMETLTIVAYRQPVTRGQIEAMRGVSADAMIRLLSDRQLIRPVGQKEDSIGRPTLFGTTNRFLETFGLETIDDLPKLDQVDQSRFRKT